MKSYQVWSKRRRAAGAIRLTAAPVGFYRGHFFPIKFLPRWLLFPIKAAWALQWAAQCLTDFQMSSFFTYLSAAAVLLLAIGMVESDHCCQEKWVGSVSYTLLPPTHRELPSQCLNNCVYTVTGTSSPKFCFRRGSARLQDWVSNLYCNKLAKLRRCMNWISFGS